MLLYAKRWLKWEVLLFEQMVVYRMKSVRIYERIQWRLPVCGVYGISLTSAYQPKVEFILL